MAAANGDAKRAWFGGRVRTLVGNTLGLLSRDALAIALGQDCSPTAARDVDRECGYPKAMPSAEEFFRMWRTNGVARRAVGVLSKWTWAVKPEVYDDPNESVETEFEKAWKAFVKGHNVWHYLPRADLVSGVGRFGLLLIGLDDGLPLDRPVPGVGAPRPQGRPPKHKVTFLRVFGEELVRVSAWDVDQESPRYGQPVLYAVRTADPLASPESSEQPEAEGVTRDVHWTRVVHLADNRDGSEAFGVPRVYPVWNNLLDLKKMYAGSAEQIWQSGQGIVSIETPPDIPGSEVDLDQDEIAEQMTRMRLGQRKHIALAGAHVNQLQASVTSPKDHIEEALRAVAVGIDCPFKVFTGSESGHLAAQEDSSSWREQVRTRRDEYLTPMVLRPFVDRLLAYGGDLPTPRDGDYDTGWPDAEAVSDAAGADIAFKLAQAIQIYVTGNLQHFITPVDFLVMVVRVPRPTAQAAWDNARAFAKVLPEPAAPAAAKDKPGAGRPTNSP